jgi:hypothetical protein
MRKLVFGAGLAFSVAGAAFAGERSRGSNGDSVTGATTDAVAPVTQEIAPGVVQMSVGGLELTARADGSVLLSEVVAEYGSVERYMFDAAVINSMGSRDGNGGMVFANGAVGLYADVLGPNSPVQPLITTAEEYKSVMGWTEMVVGADTVVMFVNGAVFNDGSLSSEPAWARHLSSVPNVPMGSDAVFADGAVFSH